LGSRAPVLLRSQWNLVDDDLLHYKHLNAFDGAMHALEERFPWLHTIVSVSQGVTLPAIATHAASHPPPLSAPGSGVTCR